MNGPSASIVVLWLAVLAVVFYLKVNGVMT